MAPLVIDIEALVGFVVLIVGLTGWLWKLHGKANENEKAIDKLTDTVDTAKDATRKEFSAVWTKSDKQGEAIVVMERSVSIHSSLLRPENLERHYTEQAEFKTAVNLRLDHLERDETRVADAIEMLRNDLVSQAIGSRRRSDQQRVRPSNRGRK